LKRILIIGATSAIAESSARIFAGRGDALFLAGRDAARLQAIAEDLRVRGAHMALTFTLDVAQMDRYELLLQSATEQMGGLDAALIAHGTLSDQAACQASVELLLQELHTNAVSAMALCTLLANHFEAQRSGTIAVISSVAGDRGRSSNYVYGSAKAAVTAFSSGLRQRLRPAGVAVVTIKPGFVDTPMTRAFKKGALWASPAAVAASIVRAMDRGTPVIYTPWFWRAIMCIIRSIPERIFLRLKL
jgi:decaprenylphospho-beta-D-erythro-pentofuranosid-2-ulose 2-reductase